ncbi:MAG: helix-turn-helix transcriptional regulator [Jiangellaceae bacterium]
MAGGRDQLGPLERVTRILLALEGSEPRGVDSEQLIKIAAFGGDPVNHPRLLQREIQNLNAGGWDIRNVSPAGETAVYRVVARDNRPRVQFTLEQQTELARAALAAGDVSFPAKVGVEVDGASHITAAQAFDADADLSRIIHAAAHHCLVRFTYKQRRRVVHPHIVSAGVSGWYLVGNEDGSDVEKRFVTDRMSEVGIDPPGTAAAPPPPERTTIDPLSWQVDPPTDVVVETTADHRPRVIEMLGAATSEDVDGHTVRLTISVTHRKAFRGRLYELGMRVRVLSPDDVRAEIIAELEQLAGADGGQP